MNISTSDYGKLTVDERLILALRAAARNDPRESARLAGSMPRVPLIGGDPRFLAELRAVHAINAWTALELSRLVARIEGLVEGSRISSLDVFDILKNSAETWLEMVKHMTLPDEKEAIKGPVPSDLPPGEFVHEVNPLISQLANRYGRQIAGIWFAVDEFANELFGFDAEILLRVTHAELVDELQAAKVLQLEPDENVAEQFGDRIEAIWNAIVL